MHKLGERIFYNLYFCDVCILKSHVLYLYNQKRKRKNKMEIKKTKQNNFFFIKSSEV